MSSGGVSRHSRKALSTSASRALACSRRSALMVLRSTFMATSMFSLMHGPASAGHQGPSCQGILPQAHPFCQDILWDTPARRHHYKDHAPLVCPRPTHRAHKNTLALVTFLSGAPVVAKAPVRVVICSSPCNASSGSSSARHRRRTAT